MIKQFLTQEICLSCQGCCRFHQQHSVWAPFLFDEDVARLQESRVALSCIAPENSLCLSAVPEAERAFVGAEFTCTFFKRKENQCGIYSLRPLECQLYPFVVNQKETKIFLGVDTQCPGIQEKLQTHEGQEYCKYLVALLKSPAYQAMFIRHARRIPTYPDIENICEL